MVGSDDFQDRSSSLLVFLTGTQQTSRLEFARLG